MPLVTVTVLAPKPPAWKSAVLDAVHRALVASGVPLTDRFQRILELSPEDLRFDPSYPDAASPRGGDFVLVEILLSVGRSVKVKRAILAELLAGLAAAPGLDPEHVMVVFEETQWENWSFAGGRLLHVG
jgi:phenylpyruvate tautomerase PptA (4-oxalocrotonate tautomerase family)